MKKIVLLPIVFLFSGCITYQSIPKKTTFYNQETFLEEGSQPADISDKMGFWTEQRKGANAFLNNYRQGYFQEAKKAGIQYLRYGPNLLPADEKDFLIGDLNNFTRLNEKDLQVLMHILDDAYRNGVGIVLTMFELPGQRYGDVSETGIDGRLWQDEKYWIQAFEFWKQLARAVKDHPAIVAYNPLNEPVVTSLYGYENPGKKFERWLEKNENTTADLNLFNRLMVKAIREVDQYTPIMLDGYFWADPKGLPYTKPIKDPNILYAFHNPAPWDFSSLEANMGRYSYPNFMPKSGNGQAVPWTTGNLETLLKPVIRFKDENCISNFQIVASEFWCNRRVHGCSKYLRDLISIYNTHNWHWGFWQFRSDGSYNGLDYELGDAPDSGLFIVSCYRGDVDPENLKRRFDNPMWSILSAGLKGEPLNLPCKEESTIPATKEEIDKLISELHDEEWIVRESAAASLSKHGKYASKAVPHLLLLLEDEEWLVRRSSIYALSKIGALRDNIVREKIENMKKDPEKHVRIEVNLALGYYQETEL